MRTLLLYHAGAMQQLSPGDIEEALVVVDDQAAQRHVISIAAARANAQ